MKSIVVSVIIPVFNGLEYTKKCLKNLSLLQHSEKEQKLKLELVVVDDGSKDGTDRYIQQNYPEVHLLKGDGSLWWSGGVNKGIKHALENMSTDYILWWNNDIMSETNYFDELYEILVRNKDHDLVGSKILRLHDLLIWGMGGRFDPVSGAKFMFGERQNDAPEYQKPLDVDWFPGMGTCIHKSVFQKIGYLNEKDFPQYHGDSDFTYRAKKAGFKLIAFPQLVIYNDTTNTGIQHDNSFKKLYASLTGIKSNYNIQKNLRFLKLHAESSRVYLPLMWKYLKYIGGFLKWKILANFGVKKNVPDEMANY